MRCCLEAPSGDGECHSDRSKVSWRVADPWPLMEGGGGGETVEKRETQGKAQHTRKGSDSRNRGREGSGGRRTRGREVCGGPTPNPASAPGFGNRGAISVKTHSLPAYRLNEATSVFKKRSSLATPSAITHTEWRKTWKPSIALFKNPTIWLSEHCSTLLVPENCCKMTSVSKTSCCKRRVRSLQPDHNTPAHRWRLLRGIGSFLLSKKADAATLIMKKRHNRATFPSAKCLCAITNVFINH